MNTTMISIIICTKNRKDKLKLALNSVVEQTYKKYEVILVNDGGEMLTPDELREFECLDINLIQNQKSKGISAARNSGMEQAKGEYIAFLDDDDLYLPDHLSNAMEMLNKNNSDFYYCSTYISKVRTISVDVISKSSLFHGYEYDFNKLMVLCYIPMSTVVIKNPVKSFEGFFDSTYPVCEDWELWLRLIYKHDYKVAFDNRISAIYYRVPQEVGFTNNALENTNKYKFVVSNWLAIVEKYPTQDPLIVQDRELMKYFHNACILHLQKGNKLAHFSYENFTKLIMSNTASEVGLEDVHNLIDQLVIE